MRHAAQKLIHFAPGRVWAHSALIASCASALTLDAFASFLGPVDSPAPFAALSALGLGMLLKVYRESPRDWAGFVHFFKHWHRANGCKERRRERERDARERLEKLEERREQERRIKLWKLTRRGGEGEQ